MYGNVIKIIRLHYIYTFLMNPFLCVHHVEMIKAKHFIKKIEDVKRNLKSWCCFVFNNLYNSTQQLFLYFNLNKSHIIPFHMGVNYTWIYTWINLGINDWVWECKTEGKIKPGLLFKIFTNLQLAVYIIEPHLPTKLFFC